MTERQAGLLAAIRREGGNWSPARARDELIRAGHAVASNLALETLKELAEAGYLEQTRPRSNVYRLKTATAEAGK